jgi:type II secretory pathway pseudopilin PulG
MHDRTTRHRRPAFTRTDLLVLVVAGLLVAATFLAGVQRLDEQTRIDQCITNLRQVMRATSMYLTDYQDQFPFADRDYAERICTWSAAGRTTDDYWLTAADGAFFIDAAQRPLNPYLLGGVVEPDVVDNNEIIARTDFPMLRCPSDSSSNQRRYFTTTAEPINQSAYTDVGTSYHFNLVALTDVNFCGNTNPWAPPGAWNDIGRALVREVLDRHAGEFAMYFEDPMDWGLHAREAQVGSHGEFSKHAVGFLDGHADYAYRDTRGYCGPDWVAINPGWVRSYGYIPRPVSYRDVRINCDPVQE